MLSVILLTVKLPWLLLPFWGSIIGFSSGGINALFLSSWRLDTAAACLVWRSKNKRKHFRLKSIEAIQLTGMLLHLEQRFSLKIQYTKHTVICFKSTIIDITLISSSFFFLFWLFLRKYSPLSRSLSIYKSQTGNSVNGFKCQTHIYRSDIYATMLE